MPMDGALLLLLVGMVGVVIVQNRKLMADTKDLNATLDAESADIQTIATTLQANADAIKDLQEEIATRPENQLAPDTQAKFDALAQTIHTVAVQFGAVTKPADDGESSATPTGDVTGV